MLARSRIWIWRHSECKFSNLRKVSRQWKTLFFLHNFMFWIAGKVSIFSKIMSLENLFVSLISTTARRKICIFRNISWHFASDCTRALKPYLVLQLESGRAWYESSCCFITTLCMLFLRQRRPFFTSMVPTEFKWL